MLVLSRRERQRIKLGDSIVITVVRVAGDKVRLGIEAPTDMLVLRDELDIHPKDGSVEVTFTSTPASTAPAAPAALNPSAPRSKALPRTAGLAAKVAARSASAA